MMRVKVCISPYNSPSWYLSFFPSAKEVVMVCSTL
jgi:hypothetical protein